MSDFNRQEIASFAWRTHDFAPQHIYEYAFVVKSLQLHVSPRFSAPRYDTYCKIWDNKRQH
jgi:hypothetical protein